MRTRSIRRFLLWSLLGVVVAGAGGSAAWTYLNAAHEVEELFDAELAQSARVLAGLTDRRLLRDGGEELAAAWRRSGFVRGAGDGAEPGPLGHPYETKLSFRVREPDGRTLFRTPGAPERHGATPHAGFDWIDDGTFRWRVFSLEDEEDGLWMEVGQREDVRDELTREIAVDLFLQSLLPVVLLLVLVPAIVAAGFAPVRRIAREIDERAPSNLHPVDTGRVPDEVRSLVDALNRMFNRLASAFEAERRFTADAAHELRTPIAGMLVHAENARRARTESGRAASLDKVAEGIRRMQRLVEQLLTLSRLDPDAGLGEWQSVDLGAIAAEEMAQVSERRRRADVTLELSRRPGAVVTGNPTMLGVLVRNLLDNALKHTPAGGEVRVSVVQGPGEVAIEVADTGPGIPAELRGRVLERFYRGPDAAAEGSGLGLSIVRRIADIHGAALELADGGPGLVVTVRFPGPDPSRQST